MERQDFSLVEALEYFKAYVLHSHITSYVPSGVVNDILTQTNPDGKRSKWIVVILEYDMEINPTKLIKGQGLAKLMAESNFHALDINFVAALEQEDLATPKVSENFVTSPWCVDIVYVLQNLQASPSLRKTKAIFLKLKVVKFYILDQALYWKDVGGILLNCLLKDEEDKIMK